MASSPQLPPLSPKSKSTLYNDIKLIMHSYGDVNSPLPQSVELVMSILKEQIHALMCHLADVCNLRETTTITQDEILFLYRNNKYSNSVPEWMSCLLDDVFLHHMEKVKLQRLLQHIKVRDLRASLGKETELNTSESAADVSKGKKQKLCESFLSKLDSTGRLSSLDDEVDVVRQRRLMRQDLMTRTMNEDNYMKYHESRQVSLAKRLKSAKVRDWLFGDVERQYKISAIALELIAYCMHEVIAEILDLVMMLKSESKSSVDPSDRLNPLLHNVNPDWLAQRAMLTSDLSAHSMLTSLNTLHNPAPPVDESLAQLHAVTTDEIREALRRRSERTSLLHPQSKRRSPSNLLFL